MRISPILWCIIYSLRLIQTGKCVSKYFKILQDRRRLGIPVKTISTDSGLTCVMRCTNEKWCEAINFINNAGLQNCELFSEHQLGSGLFRKDELSVYYYALHIEDDTNKTRGIVSVSSTAHAPTSMTSSSAAKITSSTALLSMTSSSTATTLSSAVLLSTTSVIASQSMQPSSVDLSSSSVSPLLMTSSVFSPVATSMPAVACKKIFQDNPSSLDGEYTIFGGTANEVKVFCDMTGTSTGCKGGGWTLVMRIDGHKQTFKYSSFRWTSKQDYQPYFGQWLERSEETKLSTYHTTSFTQICLGMKYNNELGWTTLNLTSTSLFDLVSSNTYHATALAVPEWKRLIPSGTVLQPQCRIQGINAVQGDTGVRIGIIATKTCGVNSDYNSRLGFGAKGWSCGQDGNNICGNDARCDQALSKKTKGYILVK